MKRQFFLHIGLYKCASTYIQKNLLKIKDENIEVFTPENGREIYNNFRELIIKKNEKKNLKFFENFFKKKKVLISIEGLFGHQSNGFADINYRLKIMEKIFNKPKYLIMLRQQSTLLYSAWHQGLRNNINLNFENYVSIDKKTLFKNVIKNFTQGTNYKIYDYNQIFKKYLNLKRNRVKFLLIENYEAKKKNFFNDILQFFEVKKKITLCNNKYNVKINQYRTNLLAKQLFPKFHNLQIKITIKIAFLLNILTKNKLWNPITLFYLNIVRFFLTLFYKQKKDNFYKNIDYNIKKIDKYFEIKNKIFFKKVKL